jgi:hypothetical protein
MLLAALGSSPAVDIKIIYVGKLSHLAFKKSVALPWYMLVSEILHREAPMIFQQEFCKKVTI